jgi:hypothetical protein
LTVEEFFEGYAGSRRLFEAVDKTLRGIGPADIRVTKSQIAFRRKKAFAWAWVPEKSLHRRAAPLVLSMAFRKRDPSPRWKQIVEPAPGRFMHHLELWSIEAIDDEVGAWLRAAWEAAG